MNQLKTLFNLAFVVLLAANAGANVKPEFGKRPVLVSDVQEYSDPNMTYYQILELKLFQQVVTSDDLKNAKIRLLQKFDPANAIGDPSVAAESRQYATVAEVNDLWARRLTPALKAMEDEHRKFEYDQMLRDVFTLGQQPGRETRPIFAFQREDETHDRDNIRLLDDRYWATNLYRIDTDERQIEKYFKELTKVPFFYNYFEVLKRTDADKARDPNFHEALDRLVQEMIKGRLELKGEKETSSWGNRVFRKLVGKVIKSFRTRFRGYSDPDAFRHGIGATLSRITPNTQTRLGLALLVLDHMDSQGEEYLHNLALTVALFVDDIPAKLDLPTPLKMLSDQHVNPGSLTAIFDDSAGALALYKRRERINSDFYLGSRVFERIYLSTVDAFIKVDEGSDEDYSRAQINIAAAASNNWARLDPEAANQARDEIKHVVQTRPSLWLNRRRPRNSLKSYLSLLERTNFGDGKKIRAMLDELEKVHKQAIESGVEERVPISSYPAQAAPPAEPVLDMAHRLYPGNGFINRVRRSCFNYFWTTQ